MLAIVKRPFQLLLIAIGRVISAVLFDLRIEGIENLRSTNRRPLILIANHFSWFDAPLLSIHLPFQPAFLVATESYRNPTFGALLHFFDCIPVWRGQVDRSALRRALTALARGRVIGIFPEGGMNPENAARLARGERIFEVRAHASRLSATLANARPGSALLAVDSHAYIVPVAVMGTEQILENLPRFRRTKLLFRIGSVFGPLEIDPALRGPARRARLDELTFTMMVQLAKLFPPEKRGPYAAAVAAESPLPAAQPR
jgi:1-acyl-sn-glycerol-3-phosphate acyltransferase